MQKSVDLTSKIPTASNFKFRFRLRTDGNTVDDGWYVDDVLLTGFTPAGVSQGGESAAAPGGFSVRVYPNPAGRKAVFLVEGAREVAGSIDIYDIAGRHVAGLAVDKVSGRAEWNLWGKDGLRTANGIYFYRVTGVSATAIGRLQVIR